MALFRSILWSDPLPAIEGKGVHLRMPRMTDWADWALLREESRAFLAPWEPVWPEDDLTRAAFRRRLQRYANDQQTDLGYAFLIFRTGDNAVLGGATLNNVRRGVAQAASLGYWMGAQHAGKGYMSAALRALVPFAHGALRLRRVEAACLPHNAASVRLLEKLNFTREGLAREYLCIAGRWQDHVLFARLQSDPLP
ncbi:MAG: GNAT family N-acetyltransferase [Bradyrhizobiaceae bacterium]|nr:GNAT family N-acetyltransferase [Bradyrhizobiaceae bacterium]